MSAITANNAIIHYYPDSPCIAKTAVNLRHGKHILFRAVLKDIPAAMEFVHRVAPRTAVKIIRHA